MCERDKEGRRKRYSSVGVEPSAHVGQSLGVWYCATLQGSLDWFEVDLLVLLLNLVGVFFSIRPRWSGGNDLYHSCTSFEGASRGGQPLIFLHDS